MQDERLSERMEPEHRPVLVVLLSSAMDEYQQVAEYVRNVGREPENLPEDHPDRWQWLYRGTRDEREHLLERLVELPQEVHQQEELWPETETKSGM